MCENNQKCTFRAGDYFYFTFVRNRELLWPSNIPSASCKKPQKCISGLASGGLHLPIWLDLPVRWLCQLILLHRNDRKATSLQLAAKEVLRTVRRTKISRQSQGTRCSSKTGCLYGLHLLSLIYYEQYVTCSFAD